jgi:hypothetical protein
MNSTKKVYCSFCKYYCCIFPGQHSIRVWCESMKHIKTIVQDTPIYPGEKLKDYSFINPYICNKNNDCFYYKRKWYLFWR